MNKITSLIKNNQNTFDTIFKKLRIRPLFIFTLYLIYSFLFRIPYLPISILGYITFIFVITFIFYLIFIFRDLKKHLKTPYFIFLFLFLISNVFSFIFYEKSKITFMTSDVLNHIVLLVILYPTQENLFENKNFENFKFLMKLIQIWNIGIILISEFMLLLNYSGVTCTGYDCHSTGILGTRLYGIYTDPNYASVLAVITILISIFFILNSEKIISKILNSIVIIASYIFIIFTYSRTSFIGLIISISFISFYYLFKILKKNIFISIFSSIILIGLLLYLPTPIRNIYNQIYPLKIERNSYVENVDISNNRFDIWTNGIKAISENPLLGIGYRNIKPYFNENYPNSYIANHNKAYELHNVILNILISQGVIGLIPFIVFTFLIIKFIWNGIRQTYIKENHIVIVLLISIILAISCESMFISDILYLYTPSSIIFWVALGNLIKTIPSINQN